MHPRAASRPDRPMSGLAPFVSSSLRGEECSRKNGFLKVRGSTFSEYSIINA
jgi:hypothetical protein